MTDDIEKRLQALVLEYLQSLPNRMAEIQNQWHEVRLNFDQEKFFTLYKNVHSLCGTTGSYGFKDLSLIAREATNYLKEILHSQKSPTAEQKTMINSLLDKLEIAIMTEVQHKKSRPHSDFF